MEHGLLLSCVLPTICFVIVFAVPVREKLSINTDILHKVREQMNETTRDKTARNINFAWRVSYTRSTTDPTKAAAQTTVGIQDIEQNQVEYQKIFSQLTVTLKDPKYRIMWTELVKKGYPHFVQEVKAHGHKVFMKDNKDGAFEGPEGVLFWNKIVGFLETMGQKGFELLLQSVDNTPLETKPPGAAGGGEQQTTIHPPSTPEPPKAEEKPTDAPAK